MVTQVRTRRRRIPTLHPSSLLTATPQEVTNHGRHLTDLTPYLCGFIQSSSPRRQPILGTILCSTKKTRYLQTAITRTVNNFSTGPLPAMSCVGTTRLSPKPPPSPWGSPSRTQSCTFGGPQWQALLATTACMACLVWAPTLRRPHHRPKWSPPRCCTPRSNIPTGRRSRGRSCRRLLNMELASSMVRFRRYQRTKAVPSPSAVAVHLHVASLLLLLLIVVSSPLTTTTPPATTNTPPITPNLTSTDTTPVAPNLAPTTPPRTTALASPTLRSTLPTTPLGTTTTATTTTTTPLPSNKLGLFSPEVGDGANDGSMARQPEGEGGEKDKGLHCVLGVEDVFGCRGRVSTRRLLSLPRSPHREGSRALYTLTPQPSDRDRG